MKLFVGNTDRSWYAFLRDNGLRAEANFWRPRAQDRNVNVIEPGELFFFRLKRPVSAIAGFGVFRHHTVVPLSFAWEAFGIENGCASFDELVKMIAVHHPGEDVTTGGDWHIGCTVITDLVFYPENAWLDMPMAPGIVRGKSFDVLDEEGSRIWNHMIQTTGALPGMAAAPDPFELVVPSQRPTELRPVRLREQQGLFRTMVVDAYGRRCCVTGERTLPVIDAAHIQPYVNRNSNDVKNGLALRKDIHSLFDHGYVAVDDSYRFLVSNRIDQQWHNGRIYYDLQGKPIRLPDRPDRLPSLEALRWHRQHIFHG